MPQWISISMGAGISLFATYFTARVNLKQSNKEKWWILKREAYSKIIEALYHGSNCFEKWSEEELSGQDTFTETKKKELSDDYDKASRDLNIAAGIGAYIISDKVAKVLAELHSRPRSKEDEPRFEAYETEATAYKTALQKVRTLAKEDLEIV